MIAIYIAFGAAIPLGLCLARVFAGPTLYDRALGATAVSFVAMVIAACLAVAARQAEWIDLAFVFLFASVAANAAVLKFVRARSFQPPLVQRGDPP